MTSAVVLNPQETPAGDGAIQHGSFVRFVSGTKYQYSYPLILCGYLLAVLNYIPLTSVPVVYTWLYIGVLMFIILTMGADFNRDHTIVGVGAIVLIVFGGIILDLWLDLPVLRDIVDFFKWFTPEINAGAMFVISTLLAIGYVVMIGLVLFNNRWHLSDNILQRIRTVDADDFFGKNMGYTFRVYFPDTLERVLLGAGSILIKDGERVVREITDIAFLSGKREKIQEFLDSLSVIQGTKL